MLLLFSAGNHEEAERVYRVALSELAATEMARAAPPPSPESVPEPLPPGPEPLPEPKPEPPREPETKIVSAKKTMPPARPKPEPKPAAPERQPSSPVQSSGPRQFGGFSAYEQDHVDQRPAIVRRAEPEYPARARRMNIEGAAVVELVVDASGFPKACAIRSASPSGYFEEAALNAARKMRFMPGKVRGIPVNTLVLLPFSFRLR
jgi:protein TonB